MSYAIGVSGVTTQNAYATHAAARILEDGGNAFDAAIAASAVLSIVLPQTSGLGGDGFLLAVTDNEELIAYNASGPSLKEMDADAYLNEKPMRGPLTVTIPGLVRLWEWINNNHAKKNIETTLSYAYNLAKNGFYLQPSTGEAINRYKNELSRYPTWKNLFSNLQTGDYTRFPRLANILEMIMKKGTSEYYEGRTAELLVEKLNKQGVPITFEELSKYRGEETRVITDQYREYEISELPPNSQGIITILLMKRLMADDIDKEFLLEGKISHYLQLLKKIYIDRDINLGDPRYMSLSIKGFLDEKRPLGKRYNDTTINQYVHGKDTTFFIVTDKYGNMVGFIQSLFHPFGSGIVVEDIVFQNRGAGFAYRQGLPNSPAPSKKPLHTLSITVLSRDKKERVMIGCAGGDYRPQIHAQIIMNIVLGRKSLWRAVLEPRIILKEWNKKINEVLMEEPLTYKASSIPQRFKLVRTNYPGATGVVQAGIKRGKQVELTSDVRGQGTVLFT